jgi:hypothetical protein
MSNLALALPLSHLLPNLIGIQTIQVLGKLSMNQTQPSSFLIIPPTSTYQRKDQLETDVLKSEVNGGIDLYITVHVRLLP